MNTEMRNGLPENINSINGYFFAGYNILWYDSIRPENRYFTSYAAFREPGSNLIAGFEHLGRIQRFDMPQRLGNIDVGQVQFNRNHSLGQKITSHTLTYSGPDLGPLIMDSSYNDVALSTEGNRTFTPIKCNGLRSFPILKSIWKLPSISKNKAYFIDASNIANNYDSITVTFYNALTYYAICLRKSFSTKQGPILEFTAAEMNSAFSEHIWVDIDAFNYTHQTINGKIYVFEQAKRTWGSVNLIP